MVSYTLSISIGCNSNIIYSYGSMDDRLDTSFIKVSISTTLKESDGFDLISSTV